MSQKLFDRRAILTVDRIQVEDLRIAFRIKKSLKPEPNTAEIHVWNLNPDNRAKLEALPQTEVKLEVGYKSGTSIIFLGDLRTAYTTEDPPDLITTIASGDGEEAQKKARINQSFGPGTSIDTVLRALARALGVGQGNVARVAAELRFSGVGTLYSSGVVLSGPVSREMTDFARSAGLEWSIQDGALMLLNRGRALERMAVLLSPETGLIGTPSVTSKGKLSCVSLLIPDLYPGRMLMMAAARVKGLFRIEQIEYIGDTHGQEWYAVIEGASL